MLLAYISTHYLSKYSVPRKMYAHFTRQELNQNNWANIAETICPEMLVFGK